MRCPIRLQLFVALMVAALILVLILGYTILSAHYFVRGMDSVMAGNMEAAARSYLESTPPTQRNRAASFSGFQITRNWEQLPTDLRQWFDPAAVESGLLQKQSDAGWFSPPDQVRFLVRLNLGKETLYIGRTYHREEAPRSIGRYVRSSHRLLLAVSLTIGLLLLGLLWLLMRHIARPARSLLEWTRGLDAEGLQRPPPDFAYPEFNELAELIRTSLDSVQQGLEREQRFLRHASHELRTPIAVIRNNVELLHKLQTREQQADEREAHILDRIDRAGHTMQHLTETLLWLDRDGPGPAASSVELEALVSYLAEEHRYLLQGKPVTLALDTRPETLQLPEFAAAIVLANLIRNAFQHTHEGEVQIRQQGGEVEISNPLDGEAAKNDLGFGLGQQLVERITERLGWDYRQTGDAGFHTARIRFDANQERRYESATSRTLFGNAPRTTSAKASSARRRGKLSR